MSSAGVEAGRRPSNRLDAFFHISERGSTVQRELHRMILDINSRYTVAYQSHGNASGWRSINVTTRRRGIEILNARKGYFAE